MQRTRLFPATLFLMSCFLILPRPAAAEVEMETGAAVSSLIGPNYHLVVEHELRYTLDDFTDAVEVRYDVAALTITGPFGMAWNLSGDDIYDHLVQPDDATWVLRSGQNPGQTTDGFSLFFSAADPSLFPMNIEYDIDITIRVRTNATPDVWDYRGHRVFHGTTHANVEAAPTPVEAATWGSIKRLFR